jgi:tetratricopeptide (TPR) repeat protein
MKRVLPTVAFLLLSCGVARAAEAVPASDPAAIAKLIEELGSDQFALRRRAEEELTRLGPAAQEQLKLAEQSNDLEVAERASYILQSMRVDWLQPQDSPEVRRALARFGDLSREEKQHRIQLLVELPNGQGFPALCRIARLEHIPGVARRAAIALLEKKPPAEGAPALFEACRQELQGDPRPAAAWIDLWIREQADRQATLADWNKAIDAEVKLLKDESPDTDFPTIFGLMERRLDACNELKLVDETTAALLAIVDLMNDDEDRQQFDSSLVWAIGWVVDHENWNVLFQLYEKYRGKINGDRKLLYRYAAALSRAGQTEAANKLAERAFAMKVDEPIERISIAAAIAEIGAVDWALREYNAAIEAMPPLSYESLIARREVSTWLHDRQDYKGASDVLREFFDQIQAKENRLALRELRQQLDGTQYLNAIEGRQLLYQANHHHSRGEYDLERETLENAYKKYDDDPDILIAMFRMPNATAEYKQKTRQRIAKMAESYANQISESPEDPSKYNQWAWLVSNTEGDFAQAVQHSLHSLELSPNEPSYLDTLGRCYFTAGDVENAIKSQQKAVELAPQYQIMRRQLAEFEKAKK